jgi:polysaccharide export outer membrane protein
LKIAISGILILTILGGVLLSQEVYDKRMVMMDALRNPYLAPETYLLGPGDRLELNLWGNANATYSLYIRQDGKIFIPKYDNSMAGLPSAAYSGMPSVEVIPALGEINAEDLTVSELKQQVEDRVKKYFRGVNVRIALVGLRAFTVSILGAINEPGVYSITPLYRLSNLIEIADDISYTGSHRNISIEHADGTSETFDLYGFLYRGNLDQNPLIQAGDIIRIPQAIMSVKISGRILRRGNYELKEGERIKDLIEIAGGFQDRGSLTRSIKVYNIKTPEKIIEVDPYKLLIENDSLSNIELHTGDVITVPMEPFTVTVVGQVTRGGTFEFEPGADFNYYLGLAGGYGERANEGDIRITRWDGTRLKWKQGVEIKPGDTVVIGRSELKGWRDYLEVTLNAANLLFIIWTVSR